MKKELTRIAESIPWTDLSGFFNKSIPRGIELLQSADEKDRREGHSLLSDQQGTLYDSTFYTIPFLSHIVIHSPDGRRDALDLLIQFAEVCAGFGKVVSFARRDIVLGNDQLFTYFFPEKDEPKVPLPIASRYAISLGLVPALELMKSDDVDERRDAADLILSFSELRLPVESRLREFMNAPDFPDERRKEFLRLFNELRHG